jgi:hypothetical protein
LRAKASNTVGVASLPFHESIRDLKGLALIESIIKANCAAYKVGERKADEEMHFVSSKIITGGSE